MSDTTKKQPMFEPDDWHITVLRDEAVQWMLSGGGRHFVDGTLGGGGHAELLLRTREDVELLGIDRDPEALHQATQRLQSFGERLKTSQGSYATLATHLEAVSFPEKVDGILLDLGVNSRQLDDGERGFSFRHDGPLDMRFNSEGSGQTAADVVNTYSVEDLARIFRRWGEEPQAKRAAKAIVAWRETKQPFSRTFELKDCLHAALPVRRKKKAKQVDPATRCFQALRIAVNEELVQLETFLETFTEHLNVGGRIVIISFHSLEDRMVKRRFQALAKGCICPPDLPVCGCGIEPSLQILTRKPIWPSDEEVTHNPRARSARLRAAKCII